MILVSFDIDGTLETGDPPGPVPLDLVTEAKRRGYVVGSASDRTLAEQRRMWTTAGIIVDFVGHKHHLTEVTSPFGCTRLVHIGDTLVDQHYAHLAGFEFWHVDTLPAPMTPDWLNLLTLPEGAPLPES
ncbi:MAG TPA: hypothetical protein VMU76_04835 [Acidimicrobiales bacterium]|nr:hypothetical protein [Acidimicrobiales bacterium]